VHRSPRSGDFHENLAQYKGQPVASSRIELTMPPAMDDSAVTTTMVVSVARTRNLNHSQGSVSDSRSSQGSISGSAEEPKMALVF
jgi:hypothetical protein